MKSRLSSSSEVQSASRLSYLDTVVSRCRGSGPPSSGIVLKTLCLLAADLRRHLRVNPYPVSSVVLVCLSRAGFLLFPAPFPCRVSISQSTGILGSARLRGFVFCPGGSAVWPQCWLCAVCAVGHIGCCVGGEYPVGVSIASSLV